MIERKSEDKQFGGYNLNQRMKELEKQQRKRTEQDYSEMVSYECENNRNWN